VFFIVYYFFGPELFDGATVASGTEVVELLMINYRLATFFTWMGTACAVGVLGILLLPPDTQIEKKEGKGDKIKDWFANKNNIKLLIRVGLIIVPVIIGILALTLSERLFMDPDFVEPINLAEPMEGGYGITDDIIKVTIGSWEYPLGRLLFNFIFMPLFLALIPFVFLYLAWKTFGVLRKSYALNAIGFLLYFIGGRILKGALDVADLPHVRAILPPLIILLALLIMVIANNYEQLK
jgi:hypothetical protein